jgi:hypothetical protein
MYLSVPMLLLCQAIVLLFSSVANALDPNDRSFYKFFVRFMRGLTLNLVPLEKELHITLPTQAGQDSNPPATSTQN